MNITRRIHLNPQSKGNLGKSFEAEFRTAWLDRLGIPWNGFDLDDRHHTFVNRHPGAVQSYQLGNEHESKTALLKLFRRVLKDVAPVHVIDTTHDQNTSSTLADMRSVLNRTGTIGDQIKADLYRGRKSWDQARADFETERQKMEQSRKELDSRQNWRDWFVFGRLVFAVLLLGMAIGLLLRK